MHERKRTANHTRNNTQKTSRRKVKRQRTERPVLYIALAVLILALGIIMLFYQMLPQDMIHDPDTLHPDINSTANEGSPDDSDSQTTTPDDDPDMALPPDSPLAGTLFVTEIMSANSRTLMASDGTYPDWIELYYTGTEPVNLKGYQLSDRLDEPDRYIFPELILEPDSYLVVFASGSDEADLIDDQPEAVEGIPNTNQPPTSEANADDDPSSTTVSEANADDDPSSTTVSKTNADDDPSSTTAYVSDIDSTEVHVPFRLSRDGEVVILSDPEGYVLSYIEFPALPDDMSYGMIGSEKHAQATFYYLSDATPGGRNTEQGFPSAAEARPEPDFDLYINEYILKNLALPDSDGDLSDWAELYNAGRQPVALKDFGFSDRADQPFRWTFPDITLAPGDYLLIWLSGKDKDYQTDRPDSLHATFSLSSNDEVLLLSDPYGRPIDQVTLADLPSQVSHGRNPDALDQWQFFPRPTPGRPNQTKGFNDLAQAQLLQVRDLWINEVSLIDSERLRGITYREPDWIELYNNTDQTINLDGYGLSDRQDDLYRMTLANLAIDPHDYLLIKPDTFGLAATGETIWLSAPDHDLIDWFETGSLTNGMSAGRPFPADTATVESRLFFTEPTPGRPNDTDALIGQAPVPFIDARDIVTGAPHHNLYFDQQLLITLAVDRPDAVIHYTLDGTQPDENAPVYTQPLIIDKNTALRSISLIPGSRSSRETTRTFLRTDPHALPVMSLQIDPTDFYDSQTGVYGNFTADLEQQAWYEYYEADGTLAIDFTGGLTLHGSFSRREDQKSMQIRLRSMYGQQTVTYPFFADNPVITHKRLILRTSGQDWQFTKLRDAFMTRVIKDYTAQDTMDVQSCVLYVNGEYFGLYEIREKVNKHYMEAHHGFDADAMDVIKGNRIVLSGDMQAYDRLLRYARNQDLRQPEAYQHVLSQIDEESLMDFLITQSFFSNPDSGNKKFWRPRTEDGQWRWVFFDLDWALYPTTYHLNWLRGDLLNPEGHGSYRIFDTSLQIALMENDDFRQRFIERYAWFLNEVFVTDRMLDILDEMTEQIRSEMPRQIARWGKPASMTIWERHVADLRRITSEKRDLAIRDLRDTFHLSSEELARLLPDG